MEWNGSVQSTSYPHSLQPCSTKSGFEQLPSETAFHISNPTNLFTLRILWFLRSPIFGELGVVWNGGGLDLESVQSQQKESGRSNWAAGGRKSQCSANAWWWWCRCLWLRYYSNSNLFPRQNHSCSRFLRIKIHVAFARLCQMSNVIISIPGQYMQSPNITVGVPKRYFTPQKHTNTKHVHIHFRTRPWLIRDQWSMVNTIFDTLKWNQMDLYNQHPHNSQPCSTKSGLEQLPTQLSAHSNCLPHFQPYQPLHSEQHSLVPPFPHLWWARRRPEWQRTWSGVGAESKQRKVGGATGPQVGERVNAQPMLDDGGEGFCGCDTILSLIFSLVRIAFVVGFLRIKIHVAFR